MAAQKQVKLTLTRSPFGRLPNHKACAVRARPAPYASYRRGHDTPENRGMINKISYMLKVEEV